MEENRASASCSFDQKDDEASRSRLVCETVNGSHQYVIKGYSLAKGMGTGKYMSSDTFTVGGYQWAVYFYPDGKNPEDNSMYVSVFIALASEGTDVRALFELTLLDQSGKGRHKVHSHFDRALESGPYMLKYKGSMWGYKRFFRRTSLETSDFLKDDCLAMNCTVGVVRTRMEAPRHYGISVPPPDMGRHLKYLLETGISSDIVFEVEDEIFKAHKLVLAARSPVFRAQFFGLIGNPKMDKVVVEDVESTVFKAMLIYIYSDILPDLNELIGSVSMCTSTVTLFVQHLLAAADCYGLERLKSLCESKLCREITPDTVATTLALAEQHHCMHLKSVCLKFSSGNLGAVMQTEGFGHLEETCPSLLADLLQTVAVADPGSSPSNRKRSGGSFLSLNPQDGFDSSGRRMRRRT